MDIKTRLANRIGTKITLALSMLFGVIALVACGGDEPTAAQSAATEPTQPTPTLEIIEVTQVPVPTPTSIPTATPEPEPTPTPESALTDEEVAALKDESWSQEIPEFPAALKTGSERLDRDVAAELWIDYISGTRVEFFHGGLILEFCSGGEGKWLYESATPHLVGEMFDYEIQSDPGGSWNSAIAEITLRDSTYALGGLPNGAYVRLGLLPPDKRDAQSVMMSDRPVHKSPDCD